MGVLLDSTVPIAGERARLTVYQTMQQVIARVGDEPVAISAIGYTELLHGLHRANTPSRRSARQAFLNIVKRDVPILPYTAETAEVAAKLGADAMTAGLNIPYADLLIGATALSLGYAVLTSNIRHFRLIPGLEVLMF